MKFYSTNEQKNKVKITNETSYLKIKNNFLFE